MNNDHNYEIVMQNEDHKNNYEDYDEKGWFIKGENQKITR